MRLEVEISGLNLERLLRAAAAQGLTLHGVRRLGERTVRASVPLWQAAALRALCERCGWEMRETRASRLVRAGRFLRRRSMLPVGVLLGAALLWLSSQTVLAVRVDGAGEHVAEVYRLLGARRVGPGTLKARVSLSELDDALALGVPGLSFAGARFDGSTLVVECERARMGERTDVPGEALDLVASEAGVVTRLWVQSGTPQVKPGQAVCKGQVLVRGEERTREGIGPVRAQGRVTARVWAQGSARASLYEAHTVETGGVRTRVTLVSPWGERVVKDAQPFASQDASAVTQPLVGLFLPVARRVETFAQTVVSKIPRPEAEAAAQAKGAAEELAKKECPAGAEILDKWTEYSKINDEFVCASVILEYERDIAARPGR